MAKNYVRASSFRRSENVVRIWGQWFDQMILLQEIDDTFLFRQQITVICSEKSCFTLSITSLFLDVLSTQPLLCFYDFHFVSVTQDRLSLYLKSIVESNERWDWVIQKYQASTQTDEDQSYEPSISSLFSLSFLSSQISLFISTNDKRGVIIFSWSHQIIFNFSCFRL